MKRFFLANPMSCGAIAGVLVLAIAETLALATRQFFLDQMPNAVYEPYFWKIHIIWAVIEGTLIGIPGGQSCGSALKEWLLGNRSGCKAICHTAASCIILLAAILSFFTFFSEAAVSSQSNSIFLTLFRIYFATFSLQIGVALSLFANWLPQNSEETVQIAENLRL